MQDGRNISVGDCALFKLSQDSPPFIGIIRWLTSSKNNIRLGVNWLYRPSEVKLGKGILLEAAPNEVFYTFHKDEIPAASLLHPCKVAFLPKGDELPSGISSFVCRRVFDVANKCLWWLTDQDYINVSFSCPFTRSILLYYLFIFRRGMIHISSFLQERQEEVDKLLYKTRIEMHATVQPGGRSPKPMSGPTSTSQIKPGSDSSTQNCATSLPSQVKGKKRERGDQGSEPIKRERPSKTDDGDSGHSRPESVWKSEIAKITERGGLVDSEGVERLVQLMQPERAEKKIDLIGRSILAGVIAATEKYDCLGRFVQLRGLPVLDEWLQEAHKGKIGDGSSPKDSDKSVEEFLLVLLRALDKLPVNLQALQMCNIGKSVNHLRSHKNLEIQKKARSLVDTWKKRVEAEMNINDAKSGSSQAVAWSSRPRLSEVSQGGNRHSGGSSEIAMKSSVTQLSSSKTAPVKLVQGEIAKSGSASQGFTKSATSPASVSTSLKDGQTRVAGAGNASDPPLTTVRDEKSSSSSQSHNNSQSCSSDHAKTVGFSGKEDARSSTAMSMSVSKTSGGASRHRKSVNGYPGPAVSGVQRETGSSRSSSFQRNPASEKVSQSGLTCDKAFDVPTVEGNSHKLIVKIPNRGRSPAQSASGGSFEDPSMVNSQASSPVLSGKHDQSDRNLKEKSDVYRANNTSDVNTESWQSNDFKDAMTGSDEGDGSPATLPDEERSRTGDDTRKIKTASSSSGIEPKSGKLVEASFTSMNALIESCVKCEANASVSVVDDVGMNLLASVAAGEMAKRESVSPADSPLRNTAVIEDSSAGNDAKSKPTGDDILREQSQSNYGPTGDTEKQGFWAKDGLHHLPKHALTNRENNEHINSTSIDLVRTSELCSEINRKSDETVVGASVTASPVSTTEKGSDDEQGKQLHEKKAAVDGVNVDGIPDTKPKVSSSSLAEDKVNDVLPCVELKEEQSSYASLEPDGEKNNVNEGLNTEQKPPASMIPSDFVKGTEKEVPLPSGSGKDLVPENVDQMKAEKADEICVSNHANQMEEQRIEPKNHASTAAEDRVVAGLYSVATDHKRELMEENLGNKEVLENCSSGQAPYKQSPTFPVLEVEQLVRPRGSKLPGDEADETEECASTTADASSFSATGGSDVDGKLEFDLNEGFNADDGKFGEPVNVGTPGCSAAVHLISPLPFPVSSMSSGLPASITVTAAAKGPFVPPDDLLRSKGELGWKGSAATSAFRPAEPRKTLEMPLNALNVPSDATIGKQNRPLLDFDLNMPDERILEDMTSRSSAQETSSTCDLVSSRDLAHDRPMGSAPIRCSGGLDLDLNQSDEVTDMGQHSASNSHRLVVPLLPVKSSSSVGFPNGEVVVRRDFDLNNGPVLDEVSAEPSSFSQHARSSMASQPPVACLRMNNTDIGNFSSWFPPANNYSAVTIPSIMPDREQPFPIVATNGPQRIMGLSTGGTPFNPDVYRGPVLSSSPAVPFPSTPFQYPVFPFGTNFPLPPATFSGSSTSFTDSSSAGRLCFPAVNSQLIGPAGTVPSHYPRPYVVNLSDGSNSGGLESNRRWGRQGLDLNAGPGGPEIDGREESVVSLASRQLSVASSQALAGEQARMYHAAGGVLKRKEPEGGWDTERFSYKQSSWQ